MYRVCGDSQIGKSHEISGTKCQDAFSCFSRDSIVFAAVADGLGSCKYSDIASCMASHDAVTFCSQNITKNLSDEQVIAIIKTSFDRANLAIKQKAGDELDEYDTTLTLVVVIEGNVYFGHAGDSGIVALRSDGIFEEVTKAQHGSGYGMERPVYPLASESHWVFRKYEHPSKAIFMMTDGMLNKAIPPLLSGQKYQTDNKYLFYLYDNLQKNPDVESWVTDELTQTNPQEVNHDDKTLVGILFESGKIRLQPKEYYDFPSDKLWNSLLHPYKEPSSESCATSEPIHNGFEIKSDPKRKQGSSQGQSNITTLLLGIILGLAIGIVGTLSFLQYGGYEEYLPDDYYEYEKQYDEITDYNERVQDEICSNENISFHNSFAVDDDPNMEDTTEADNPLARVTESLVLPWGIAE